MFSERKKKESTISLLWRKASLYYFQILTPEDFSYTNFQEVF